MGAFFGTALFFQFGPKEGEDSAISRFIGQYSSKAEDWAEMSAVHTRANQQAGYDKNLFENTWNKQRYVDVTYPEYVLIRPWPSPWYMVGMRLLTFG